VDFVGFFALGVIVSFIGSMIGAGGGFLLVPALLFLTGLSPQVIAGTSMFVVLAGTLSGTLGYRRFGRIDYKSAMIFIMAVFPGVVFGFNLNRMLDIRSYSFLLGALMLMISFFLMKGKNWVLPHLPPKPMLVSCRVVDCLGQECKYCIGLRRSLIVGFLVGVISPLFGVGGGFVLVPVMIVLLGVPDRIAIGTGQFIVLVCEFIALLFFMGYSQIAYPLAAPIALGAVLGAQLGSYFSNHVRIGLVKGVMGWSLGLVGLTLIIRVLF
jgi:uncharacterized protein